jgi:hypothetical protein
MIPYEIDPSLHDAEPAPALLDDGFSPPVAHDASEGDTSDSSANAPPGPLSSQSAY